MKELLDLKMIWEWFLEKWKTPSGAIIFLVLVFLSGMEVKEKIITDDCKFMGTFRDGVNSYNCNTRLRN